jgi:DNA mismatch repair protein MutS
LEQRERERTGIRSLKVGYNKVFGYYIEVSHANRHLVPPDYQRKQTLVGAERYVTPELREFESMVLQAEERIAALEEEVYRRVVKELASCAAQIRRAAQLVNEVRTESRSALSCGAPLRSPHPPAAMADRQGRAAPSAARPCCHQIPCG